MREMVGDAVVREGIGETEGATLPDHHLMELIVTYQVKAEGIQVVAVEDDLENDGTGDPKLVGQELLLDQRRQQRSWTRKWTIIGLLKMLEVQRLLRLALHLPRPWRLMIST